MVLIILWAVLLAWAAPKVMDSQKSKEAVAFINSHKITLLDVFGNNLPPAPDQKVNDSTVAGIDANKNFIRDDVELAIFTKYPNSAKIRAAELQYAQALQLELTQVFDSGTLVATLQKGSRGSTCVSQTGPEINPNDTREKIVADLAIGQNRVEEVEILVLNTELRKKTESENLKKYMTSYSSPGGDQCDIISSSLQN